MTTFTEKLEDAEPAKHETIPGRASQGVHDVFESFFDEILIDEPGAPERNDYDGKEQGYERYLYDLDEWAREGYEEAVDELQETVEGLSELDYPELGMHRLEDEEIRDQTGDDIIEVQEQLQEVIEWRKKLERIEAGFAEWD